MKKGYLWTMAALLCAGAALTAGMGVSWLAWPLVTAGELLRALSLSSGAGNLAAIVLYLAMGLWPLALKWKQPWTWADGYLIGACLMGLWGLYATINTGARPMVLQGVVGDAAYALCVYGLLFAWDITRVTRRAGKLDGASLYRFLGLFLEFCALGLWLGLALAIWQAGTEIAELMQVAAYLPGSWGNAGMKALLVAVSCGETLLLAGAFHSGAKLMRALAVEPYSQESLDLCRKMDRWCALALTVTVGAGAMMNLLQVLAAQVVTTVNVDLSLPLEKVAVLFAGLALSRLLAQGKELKEDNELFI